MGRVLVGCPRIGVGVGHDALVNLELDIRSAPILGSP